MPVRRKRGPGVEPLGQARASTAPEATEVTTSVPRSSAPPRRPSKMPLVVSTLLALGIIVGAVIASLYLIGDEESPVDEAPLAVGGPISSRLIVVEDPVGNAASLAIFVSDGGEVHSLLVIPPDLSMQIPGYGDGLLGEASAIEGADLTRLALINELGIRIDDVVTLGPGDFATALGEPVRIDLPAPFIEQSSDRGVVSASEGSDVFVAGTAETLLVERSSDSLLQWLPRQRAVWAAAAARFGESPASALAVAPGMSDYVELLETAVVTVLPVSRVGSGGTELYTVSRESELFGDRLSFLAVADERPRIEILNGTRLPGVTRPLAEELIENGYRLIKTDNAGEEGRRTTLVIAQGVENQDAAIRAAQVLGAGEVVVETFGSGVVDVSIIVGRDIATREG